MSTFLHSKYSALTAYTPGEQPRDMQYIKLNTNESPYPPSPEVLAAVTHREVSDLRLYSDPLCTSLKEAIGELYGFEKENIFISNGSDDILNFAFMAFGERGAAFADITYGFYPVYAQLHGIAAEIIPLKEDFSLDPADYYGKNKLIVIANPNAPTGMDITVTAIEEILKSNRNSVVVVDEAYVDFSGDSAVRLVNKYPNLLVCMTFSKSRSLAGARLGFAIGQRELISDLELLKFSTNPYSINRLSMRCGVAAIKSQGYYDANCKRIIETRQATAEALAGLGFEVLPSKANFIFAKKPGCDGEFLYKELKNCGILVRHFTSPRIWDYNRITIGTPEQMKALAAALEKIIALK